MFTATTENDDKRLHKQETKKQRRKQSLTRFKIPKEENDIEKKEKFFKIFN